MGNEPLTDVEYEAFVAAIVEKLTEQRPDWVDAEEMVRFLFPQRHSGLALTAALDTFLVSFAEQLAAERPGRQT